MKSLHIISLFLILILVACDSPVTQESRDTQLDNMELKRILEDYYKENLFEKQGVIVVDMFNEFSYFKGKHDTSFLYISSDISLSSIKDNLPISYSLTDYGPVLFYTGMENIFKFDSVYHSKLMDILNPYLYDDLATEINDEGDTLIYIPPNYNPVVWKVEMVTGHIIKKEILN